MTKLQHKYTCLPERPYTALYSWWWVELSPETCRVKQLRRINSIVASCWIYFTTSCQALRSPSIPLTSFHYLPVLLISSSIVLRQVSSAYLFFYIPEDSNLIQFSLLLQLLCVLCVQSNSVFFFLSDVLLVVHFMFIIRLKHLFINICSIFVVWLVVLHDS